MMLTQNAKMKKATLKTFNFDIPAGRADICFGASECLKFCYATRGFYKMPNVKAKHESNLQATKADSFNDALQIELDLLKGKGLEAVRIHSAGDFYSREYLNKWLGIIEKNPDLVFYAYTKSIPLFIGVVLPENFKVIFSKGGKFDHLIDAHNLRSVTLIPEYTDNSLSSDDDDSQIIFGGNENIELVLRKVA